MLSRLKKKKTTKESDRFYSMFVGEFVRMSLRSTITDAVTTPEGTISQQSPLSVTGYFIDMDEKYYYVGDQPDMVHSAALITDVVLIQEVKLVTETDTLMERLLDTADMGKMN